MSCHMHVLIQGEAGSPGQPGAGGVRGDRGAQVGAAILKAFYQQDYVYSGYKPEILQDYSMF